MPAERIGMRHAREIIRLKFFSCSATIWMESSDNQDGHFGGRGEVMIVAARR